MYLFLVSQSVNYGYDTYDSFVVVAENEDDARNTSPRFEKGDTKPPDWEEEVRWGWVTIADVSVKLLGKAADRFIEKEVICASFHAG
jgi:hypothetical protein